MLTEIHDYKIRTARDHDFEIIAEILYRHYQSYNWWNIVNSQVVETTWLRTTMDALRDDSRDGDGGASFIIEEAGVVAGVVSYVELKKRFDPLPESDRMPGANNSEAEKVDNSSFKEEMVTRYKKVLWLSKLAVHMGYLGKGAAKFGMRFVIDEAKKKELNVAIAVVPDEVEWYKAWGFHEVHPVRMLQNGTVPATNQMLLELFPVASLCCVH